MVRSNDATDESKTCISDIVDQIESNKDRARDVAESLSGRDGVIDAANFAGKLNVTVDDSVSVYAFATDVETEFGVTFDAHHKKGTRPRLDGPRLANDEVVFDME